MKELKICLVLIGLIITLTTCEAELTPWFDFHLLQEAPKEKISIPLEGNWNVVSDFYQEQVTECINDRLDCAEREEIHLKKIDFLKSEALKAKKVSFPDIILSWEFAGGFTVGVGLTALIIYGVKRIK